MNFDDLRKKFVGMGEKALKTLLTQVKEVMSGESYDKLMGFVKNRQQKGEQVMSECNKMLGGFFK